MPGFALLPKPLLFRNHDCVNMKPGHINCSCFQGAGGREKKQRFFLSCLFLCFNIKLNYWTWRLQNRGRSRLGWHSACDQRLSAEDTRQDSPGPKLPSLHPHLFLAAVLLKHSGSSSYFYVTTSAKSLIIFPIFWGIAYLERDSHFKLAFVSLSKLTAVLCLFVVPREKITTEAHFREGNIF